MDRPYTSLPLFNVRETWWKQYQTDSLPVVVNRWFVFAWTDSQQAYR